MKNSTRLKIGVFGGGRGTDIAKNFMLLGCDVVAVCENDPDRRTNAVKSLGEDIAQFDNFDEFLSCDMDAVILANFFHQHAPYAIKCLERGINVYCECISNGTMAEGVELLRAAEKSDAVFMLAENYPQMTCNLEMQRVCKTGTLGKILYAEGEYNHPIYGNDIGFYKSAIYFEDHWRNYLPRAYYVTHSLTPLMAATGATPKRVAGIAAFEPFTDKICPRHTADRAAIITTQNDDGSVFKFTGCSAFGAHGNSYRICGTEGQIENLRGMGGQIMLRYNAWSIPEGMEEINLYEPKIDDKDEKLIRQSGHGGSDFITARMFVGHLKAGTKPQFPYDVHSAVTMASVAILAHRSVLEGGVPYDIPDFHKEEDRKKYENDRLSPFPGYDGSAPTIPCCSHPDYAPTEEQLKNYREALKS